MCFSIPERLWGGRPHSLWDQDRGFAYPGNQLHQRPRVDPPSAANSFNKGESGIVSPCDRSKANGLTADFTSGLLQTHQSRRVDRSHLIDLASAQAAFVEHAKIHSEEFSWVGAIGSEVIGAGDDLAQTERVFGSAFHNIVRKDRRSRNRDATSSNQNSRRK